MIHLLQTTNTAEKGAEKLTEMAGVHLDVILQQLIDMAIQAGKSILIALAVFIVGRFIVGILNRTVARMLERRKVDITIQTFLKSLVNILLTIILVVSVIGALGINTTSIAALLASAGVAVGMALSGNLQNLAGGLIILMFKPFKVGDFIEAQGTSGSVKSIQIFHTILTTPDNKQVYVPNGSLSSNTVVNYSQEDTRRIEWVFCVDYGTDLAKAESVIQGLIKQDARILQTPEPMTALHAMASSSVNIVTRVWVNQADYWNVYFDMNKRVYNEFSNQGINFPFPQLTVHQAKN